MSTYYALAIGIGTTNKKNELLEVWYPKPLLNPDASLADLITKTIGQETTLLTCLLYTSPSPRDS